MIKNKGYSLIELLVVIAIFVIISVVGTQALTLSLRGTKKGVAVIDVKNNTDFAMTSMERILRNAQAINCANGSLTPQVIGPSSQLTFQDEWGNIGYFACVNGGSGTYYVASGSAVTPLRPLTDVTVTSITNCSAAFTCTFPTNAPATVEIKLNAEIPNNAAFGAEGASVNAQTRVLLRTY